MMKLSSSTLSSKMMYFPGSALTIFCFLSLPLYSSASIDDNHQVQKNIFFENAVGSIPIQTVTTATTRIILHPKEVISDETKINIVDKLQQYSTEYCFRVTKEPGAKVTTSRKRYTCNDGEHPGFNTIEKTKIPIQFSVAIVNGISSKFDNYNYENCDDFGANSEESVESIAENVATRLHNKLWDLNNANVLIYLDIRDRVVFITRGNNPNLRRILTDNRIDHVIHNQMKPYLMNDEYEAGLIKGIEAIVDILEKQKEPRSTIEIIICWTCFIVFLCYDSLKLKLQNRQQRVYAKQASELSKTETIQAEALRQTYGTGTKNCAICLEDFQSSTVGSDGKLIKLLRCGHVFDESCFLEWVTSGRGGDVTKCPICRVDVGGDGMDRDSGFKNDDHNSNGDDDDIDEDVDDDDGRLSINMNRERQMTVWPFSLFNRPSLSFPMSSRNNLSFPNSPSDDSITTSDEGNHNLSNSGSNDTVSTSGRGGRF